MSHSLAIFFHWHWTIIDGIIFVHNSHFASLVASSFFFFFCRWSWSLIRFVSWAWMNWNCFAVEWQLRASLIILPSTETAPRFQTHPPTNQVNCEWLIASRLCQGQRSVLLTSILIALRNFHVLHKTMEMRGKHFFFTEDNENQSLTHSIFIFSFWFVTCNLSHPQIMNHTWLVGNSKALHYTVRKSVKSFL